MAFIKKILKKSFFISALPALLLFSHLPACAAPVLELYGTFHAMGVIVHLASADDPHGEAAATVQYGVADGSLRQGFPLSRVSDTRFVGSLFWLEPGTQYEVRVTISDPYGGPLDGAVLTSFETTRPEIVLPTPARSLFAASNGSGTACTLSDPCALSYAINQAQPGDEVVLRGGVYTQGEMEMPRSGTSGAPIVIRSYQGEIPILDGADPDTFDWTLVGGGVWRATVNAADTHLVRVDGDRLYPYQSLSHVQNLHWSIPGFYSDGVTLYVRLQGDADPNSAHLAVSRYNHVFYLEDRAFIVFKGLTFRNYGQGGYPKAIYLRNTSDVIIEDCVFAVNDVGIGIKGNAHRNVIQNNEFYDTVFDWPWDAVKSGSGLETGGVVFYDPAYGRGNVIRRNIFHDYFDGFNACPAWTADVTNETDVYENIIYRAGDDGMETDGQCSNVRIWSNTFHDVLMGISLAPVYTGPVYAIRNVIYRTGMGNNDYSGSPFKFNSGYDTSGPMYLFHNTCDAALPGSNGLYIKAPGSWSLIFSRNNIWAGTAYAIDNYNTGQPLDFDYDNLWTNSGGNLVAWNSARYGTLAEFTAATGLEPNGLNAIPGFNDPANGDYTLNLDSPLINAGVTIPGINDSILGDAMPDIGAYERTNPNPEFTGWWYNPDEAGTGISIEVQGDALFLAWYTYGPSGEPIWYTSGSRMADSHHYSGDLLEWTGWPLGNAYSPPSNSIAGSIEIDFSFTSPNNARLSWTVAGGSGTKYLNKFMNDISPGAEHPGDVNGWWYDPGFDGMGLFIEAQGGGLFMSWYHYREDQTPRWWSSGGTFTSEANTYSGVLREFVNGQCIGCVYQEPTPTNKENIAINFTSSGSATFTWLNTTFNLQRFHFGSLQ